MRPRRQLTSQTDAVPVPVRQNRRCSAPSTSTTSPGCHSGSPPLQRPVVGDAGQDVDRLPARPRLGPAHDQPEGQQGIPAGQGADLRRGGHPPSQHHVVPIDHSHAHGTSLAAAPAAGPGVGPICGRRHRVWTAAPVRQRSVLLVGGSSVSPGRRHRRRRRGGSVSPSSSATSASTSSSKLLPRPWSSSGSSSTVSGGAAAASSLGLVVVAGVVPVGVVVVELEVVVVELLVVEVGELDPSRSTAPVRSSGSAAAIAVSHSAASAVLPLGLEQVGVGGGEPQPERVGAVEGLRVGSAAERALEDEPGGGGLVEVQAGAGLDDPELDGLLRRRGSRPAPRRPGAGRRRAGPARARSRRGRRGRRVSPLIRR